MSQLAKLFIRGSLANKTSKGLTREQLTEVEKHVMIVFNDPALGKAKYRFSSALSSTIGNEYKDIDAGLHEVLITIWQATVDVLHHRPKKEIKKSLEKRGINADYILDLNIVDAQAEYEKITGEEAPEIDRTILTDRVQRKKFYQTYIFNYLRQILRENKINKVKQEVSVTGPADQMTLDRIVNAIKNMKNKVDFSIIKEGSSYIIDVNTNNIPFDGVLEINKIADEFEAHGIKIEYADNSVKIISTEECKIISTSIESDVRVNQVSMDYCKPNEDKSMFRDHIESKLRGDKRDEIELVEIKEGLKAVRNELNDKETEVFDLLLKQPKEYYEKYGYSSLKKTNMADWLGIDVKELNKMIESIRKEAEAAGLSLS